MNLKIFKCFSTFYLFSFVIYISYTSVAHWYVLRVFMGEKRFLFMYVFYLYM